MLGTMNLGPHNVMASKNILFVSNLIDNISEGDLEIFFESFKENIFVINLNRNQRHNDLQRGQSANIIFKDQTSAEEALYQLNLRKLRGKTIRISPFEKENSVRYSNNNGNLFVKNIPEIISAREFYETFSKFGKIISARLGEDDEGNHYGYGYLQYDSEDSVKNAFEAVEKGNIFGVKLEIEKFLRKNERLPQTFSSSSTENKTIYVKNTNEKTNLLSENRLREIFNKFGKITWFKIFKDRNLREFAIISYEGDGNALQARSELNEKKIDENVLFVDILMKKSERKRALNNKINENTNNLNTLYKECNLHIRNLPFEIKEEELHTIFSKYGEIQSIKIAKYILVTKVNDEFKEYPMSKGFGYICFKNKEAAKLAKEELNEKFLPNSDKQKRPLLIDFFQSKFERKLQLQNQIYPKNAPMFGVLPPFNMQQALYGKFGPNVARNPKFNQNYNKNPQQMQGYPSQIPQIIPQKQVEMPDLVYLESLEDDSQKRDYLGEFIFKSIENNTLTQKKNLTIDDIGKITGMILGIEDILEIIDIAKNPSNLDSRIQEALELLEQNK